MVQFKEIFVGGKRGHYNRGPSYRTVPEFQPGLGTVRYGTGAPGGIPGRTERYTLVY